MLTKRLATILAIAFMPWLPLVLIINPGWGSLLLVSPYFVLLLPSVWVLVANHKRTAGPLPAADSWLQVSLFASLLVCGLTFVNFSDTPESVGSIASHWLVSTFSINRELLTDVSSTIFVATFGVVWVLVGVLLWRSRAKKKSM